MDSLFWWTGVILFGGLALLVAYCVLVEFVIVGLANALSFRRWRLRCLRIEKKHEPTLQVWRLALNPWWLFRLAVRFTGHRNRGSEKWSWHGPNCWGEWRGIGDHEHMDRRVLGTSYTAPDGTTMFTPARSE